MVSMEVPQFQSVRGVSAQYCDHCACVQPCVMLNEEHLLCGHCERCHLCGMAGGRLSNGHCQG